MSILSFRKDQYPILYANFLALCIFSYIFIKRQDYEFLAYIGLIIISIAFVNASNARANFSNALSWILSIWGWMHLAGSAIYIGGVKLYGMILLPLSTYYGIFRYDQLVHSTGMAAATIGLYYIFKSILKQELSSNWNIISLLLIASGMGIGATNEVIEFFVTVFVKNNGVGDYINTALDLVFNLSGILIAIIYLRTKDVGSNSNAKALQKETIVK